MRKSETMIEKILSKKRKQTIQQKSPVTSLPHLHSAGLQVEAEQRLMMVAEGNSTYLECLPRSRHAAVTWYKQAGENSPELNQVNEHTHARHPQGPHHHFMDNTAKYKVKYCIHLICLSPGGNR